MNDLTPKKNKVIFLVGPTAVGKTDFAIRVANDIGGDIVSADSMQLYKYMDIGSAKPTAEERAAAKHYLVDEIDPAKPFSVAEYSILAKKYINDILNKNRVPVISGGTGLYVHSLLYKMNFGASSANEDLRKELVDYAEANGNEALHAMLASEDAEAANRIHPNNVKKVIRAIESAREGYRIPSFGNAYNESGEYAPLLIGLNRDRTELYNRINLRVDLMIENGLEAEIKKLMMMGIDENIISMSGIGYKEMISYMNGEYDLNDAIDLIKKNSRHYAKRQLSWFRRYKELKWFDITEDSEQSYKLILAEINNFLNA